MATRKYEAKKLKGDVALVDTDLLPVEEAVQINVNGSPFTVTMCTPMDVVPLVRGLLHSEDVINDVNYISEIHIEKDDRLPILTKAYIVLPPEKIGAGYRTSRSLLSVSSCGICGKTELETVDESKSMTLLNARLQMHLIPKLFSKMHTFQHSFKTTGGTHAAAAFDLKGDLLTAKEDIGRHNAVDKVVGQLILDKQLQSAKVLTVSSRISYEIVIKCFRAQIPFLAAVSAPSSLAVDYAKELGITLLAFCRDDRATCYANAQHLIYNE